MLNYQPIRARYELAIRDALLPLSVPLHYDNVQEQPIGEFGSVEEYATITISFPSSTEPDLCGGVVFIRGNVQVNMHAPRMGGMMRLEQMASAVVCALMTISDYPDPENVIYTLRQHSRTNTYPWRSRSTGCNRSFSAFYGSRRIRLTCAPAGSPQNSPPCKRFLR